MAVTDELARRRYEKLIGRLAWMMRAALEPQFQGYHGQLILSGDDLAGWATSRTSGMQLGKRDVVSAGRPPPVSSVAGSSCWTSGRYLRRSSGWPATRPLLRSTEPGRRTTDREVRVLLLDPVQHRRHSLPLLRGAVLLPKGRDIDELARAGELVCHGALGEGQAFEEEPTVLGRLRLRARCRG
ncbi:hypothetical protein [Streptomyces sp. NBC_00557]|uniref:hypothetical protein n=1 Tax=Streptomyces sp. NBC_00557 TaxID=2975776 RepID=UPI002E81DFDD|nr:hypothetical protein [Streptomyces sp. NBC_00557]WUC36335.1 hypothetical protein OG956_19995 [Streptomyces sp. NBC_00557]